MLWTDDERHIPVDCRIYNKIKDGLTKNDHFRSMLQTACQRGFQPEFVLFDSWYASLENLKLIRSAGSGLLVWNIIAMLIQTEREISS